MQEGYRSDRPAGCEAQVTKETAENVQKCSGPIDLNWYHEQANDQPATIDLKKDNPC